MQVNIFESLFQFRPRLNTTPAENFLTAALVYLLNKHEPLAKALMARLTLSEIDPSSINSIKAEAHVPFESPLNPGSTVYVDMRISCSCEGGASHTILIENKWESDFQFLQLESYSKVSPSARLAAIVTERQAEAAVSVCGERVLLWGDVQRLIRTVNQGEALLDEFADFLELHGLGRKDELVNEHNGSESRDLALRLAGAHANLLLGKPWPEGILPRQFASGPRNQFKNWQPKYGRIGLIYGSAVGHDPHTDPTLFVGFLAGPDFGRPLCAGAFGIDLMLAIWAGPKIQTPDGAIESAAKELRIKHPDAIVLTRNEMGGAGGRWFRLSVRRPFFSLQSESPPLSQEVVYQTLYSWMETTFEGHRLASAKW